LLLHSDVIVRRSEVTLRANSGRIAVSRQTTFMGQQRAKCVEIAAPVFGCAHDNGNPRCCAFPHDPNSGRLST